MKSWTRAGRAATLAVAAIASACGGGGSSVGSDNGTLRLALTDAPACGYDHVYVTVHKVRVHQSAAAGDNDAGWSEVVLNPAQRVDLLSLTNGVLADLGQTPLPAGRYTQMRLVLAANDSANPMANAIVPTGGTETALTTPSGAQSGLKMNVDIAVAANQVADFVLDFDACKSFVKLGHSGRFLLKPVIRVLPRVTTGMRVVGYVSPALVASTTTVSVQANGAVVKSTPPDSTGKFVLYPVDVGTYDLVVTAQGRATAIVTGVPVTETAFTTINLSSAPIDPPTSAMRVVSGTVAAPGDPINAAVGAIKKFGGGPNVVVADGPVDGTTGGFSYALPAAAPVKTVYVPSAGSWSFTADATAPTGRYTLTAKAPADSAAPATKSIDVDVTSVDSTTTAITFP
jgi:hypothetical protein